MKVSENTKYIVAIVGLLLLGATYLLYSYQSALLTYFFPPESTKVHVHADFLFVINGTKVDLTDTEFQSSPEQILHPSLHFHDGVDTMIHRHAEDVTLADFLASLGFTLTNTCITTNTQATYCAEELKQLSLSVNGTEMRDITSYIPQEGDKILLYYSDTSNTSLMPAFESQITDDACLYSGTCPERGEPPFESCGLTCEI